MKKAAALKRLAEMALAQAEATGVMLSSGAADFYDTVATALGGSCPQESQEAERTAALIRESERQQLKFRDLLKI